VEGSNLVSVTSLHTKIAYG